MYQFSLNATEKTQLIKLHTKTCFFLDSWQMIRTVFHHFTLTKSQELGGGTTGFVNGEEVLIRPNPRTLNLFPWDIRKILTIDDVGFFGGLQLTPEEVQKHMFKYWNKHLVKIMVSYGQKVQIEVHDLDTDTKHKLFIRKWTDDENYTIHQFWIEEFVRRRELKKGMVIGMYWDVKSSSLCFSVLE